MDLEELCRIVRVYREARKLLLWACGRERSNREPFGELGEAVTAVVLGGQMAENPVQPHWDVAIPDGKGEAYVQARCLLNPGGGLGE